MKISWYKKYKSLIVILIFAILCSISMGYLLACNYNPPKPKKKFFQTTDNTITSPSANVINNMCLGTCANSIPILTYHHFLSNSMYINSPLKGKYLMNIDDFDKQMKYLYDNNYHSIDSETFIAWYNNEIELNNHTVMITFDDGNISTYYLVMPILEKYHFNGVFFVISSRINETSPTLTNNTLGFLGKDLIDDIKKKHPLIELQSHSHNLHHDDPDGRHSAYNYTYDEIYNDVKLSKEILNAKTIAYPYGYYNDKVLKAVENAKYELGFSFDNNHYKASRKDNKYQIPRVNINSEISMNRFKQYLR